MICEGLKLFLTPFVSYLISWLFHRVYWSDIGDGFEYLGSNHDMVFGYFLANIFASFVGYFIAIITCSMAIQKCSFALPITFMTPITFLIAVGCEMKWWAWDWLFDHEPNPSTERVYIGLAVFVTGFIAQSLSTTYYIWRSQDMIMARERKLFWVRSYNGMAAHFYFYHKHRAYRGSTSHSLAIALRRSLLLLANFNSRDEFFQGGMPLMSALAKPGVRIILYHNTKRIHCKL